MIYGQPVTYPAGTYSYVNGYDEARNYPVMPNQSVMLIDSANPYVYVKSNNMGKSSLRCFRIEEVSETDISPKTVTMDEYGALLKRIDELERSLKHDESAVQHDTQQ